MVEIHEKGELQLMIMIISYNQFSMICYTWNHMYDRYGNTFLYSISLFGMLLLSFYGRR